MPKIKNLGPFDAAHRIDSYWDIWADLDGSSSLTTRYVHGDAVDQLFARIGSGSTYWLLEDHLGSTRDIIDNTGAVKDSLAYDGYGNITSETNSAYRGRYTFNSREYDVETAFLYYRARYYSTDTGRWVTQDPLGFDAGDSNVYRYVMNKPTMARDPSGHALLTPNDNLAKEYFNWLQGKDSEFLIRGPSEKWDKSPGFTGITVEKVGNRWIFLAKDPNDILKKLPYVQHENDKERLLALISPYKHLEFNAYWKQNTSAYYSPTFNKYWGIKSVGTTLNENEMKVLLKSGAKEFVRLFNPHQVGDLLRKTQIGRQVLGYMKKYNVVIKSLEYQVWWSKLQSKPGSTWDLNFDAGQGGSKEIYIMNHTSNFVAAMTIVHELTHVEQGNHPVKRNWNGKMKEVEAYGNETQFLLELGKEYQTREKLGGYYHRYIELFIKGGKVNNEEIGNWWSTRPTYGNGPPLVYYLGDLDKSIRGHQTVFSYKDFVN